MCAAEARVAARLVTFCYVYMISKVRAVYTHDRRAFDEGICSERSSRTSGKLAVEFLLNPVFRTMLSETEQGSQR